MSEPGFRVVIQKRVLSGSDDDQLLQRVATVYVEGDKECRVFAPPMATGDALEWSDHFVVRRLSRVSPNPNHEIDVTDADRILVTKLVKEELENMEHNANRPMGVNPDGLHYDAYICLQGHVQSSRGLPFTPGEHCSKCGAVCIDACPDCKTPIRGQSIRSHVNFYQLPAFCYKCGHPFPWMKDVLDTARQLLYHDDKLSQDDRNELWDLLKHVMSDPKSDVVAAKRKLIDIQLGKAASATREALLDLLAKYLAEMSKP